MSKFSGFCWGLWGLLIPLIPQAALSADKIYFIYGPFNFPLSVDSLEVYAKEGKITKEFSLYASQFDEQTLIELRQTLQERHTIDGVRFSRLLRTPLMEDLLKSMGQIFSTHPNSNGFYAIRGALVSAAIHQDKEGWTAIDVMRNFPTDSIAIDTQLATKMLKNTKF
ncbi:alpha/beta hydrolase [Crocosphaera sp. UHCC 0190]|uniref:alpha/beta hydrolase n=1 Tax=Crocosphaera sp. UHCC 0190 TaxID=3110246 RepID=UPI002B1F44F6|nr:alpha/beta hydrolase [Crocosphaera sp. UHCC 0190]MEA5510487.1 alpha/beta hydrolase [Crocosphaera sp. UHCC 0190]